MAHDVFISHASIDKEIANAICNALEHKDIRCWIAPRDIPAGAKYGEYIIKAIRNCKAFLLIFSDAVNHSQAVQKELERAVLKYNKTVIPYRLEDVAMSDNIEFFLGDLHWIDAYPDDTLFDSLIFEISKSLGIELEKSVEKKESEKQNETTESKKTLLNQKTSEVRVLNIIEAQELFSLNELQVKMEQLVYDELDGVVSEHMGELEQWSEIDKMFPDNNQMLFIENDLAGFWCFVPLKEEYFEKAKKGLLKECDITLDILDYIDMPYEFRGYFLDIVISEKYRGSRNMMKLLSSFIEQVEKYAENGSFLVEWCANAYSFEGKRISEMFGLEFICSQTHGGEIFYAKVDVDTFNKPIFKRYPRLVQLYKEYFESTQ